MFTTSSSKDRAMSTITHDLAAREKLIHLSIVVDRYSEQDGHPLVAICLETGDRSFGHNAATAVANVLERVQTRALRSGKAARVLDDFYNPYSGTYWSLWAVASPLESAVDGCQQDPRRNGIYQWKCGSYAAEVDVRLFPGLATAQKSSAA